MINLEVTQQQFDTILAALWYVKSQLTPAPVGLTSSYVEVTNLMAKIGNQRDTQVRAEALAVRELAEELSQ